MSKLLAVQGLAWRRRGTGRQRRMPMHTSRLSINLATVRQQWNLREAVEACARLGIAAVDPWRDQVGAIGLEASVRAIKDSGMKVSAAIAAAGCFRQRTRPGDKRPSTTTSARSTKRPHSAPNAWSWWCGGLPKGSRDIAGARRMVADGIAAILRTRALPQYAARHRAAASDVCGGPRLRQHARAGARLL